MKSKIILAMLILGMATTATAQESYQIAGPMVIPGGYSFTQNYTCCYSNGGDFYSITIVGGGTTATYSQATTNYTEENATPENDTLGYWVHQCSLGGCSGTLGGFTIIGPDNVFPTQGILGHVNNTWANPIYTKNAYIRCDPNCPP